MEFDLPSESQITNAFALGTLLFVEQTRQDPPLLGTSVFASGLILVMSIWMPRMMVRMVLMVMIRWRIFDNACLFHWQWGWNLWHWDQIGWVVNPEIT